MKILGICCSPRKGQTTRKSLEVALEAASGHDGLETGIIDLAEMQVNGCVACGHCRNELSCPQEDDYNSLIPALTDPEVKGIIIATPVYLGTMTAQCKAFLDRSVMFRRNGSLWKDKVAGVLAVGGVRNGGQELTIQAVRTAMLCHDMICVSDGLDTSHFGASLWSGGPGGLENDSDGLKTARNLGKRVAEVAARLS